ncbi:hypothetical protein AG4045_016550 [Apium graveolens]|uniref:Uncharacterized protein n=3 Tax=Apium graveolens TaxID=4045 RepID=A0A6L5BBE3_APIGR|nr:hypothetical protein AG4045_016550 [Apium graveolens]
MFVLIILVLCSTIFVLAVTHKGAGKALSGRGYKEYRLGDYSHWLQNRVNNYEKWRRIKTCLQYSKVCMPTIGNHDASNAPAHLFYSKRLSAIQSGCCKPPDWCNFTYVSPTYWNKPTEAELPYTTTDCALWQNDPNVLCLDCESCKAGILDNLKSTWKKAAIVNTVFLKCLTVVYAIGCCAFRNTRKDDSWKRPPSGFVVQ